MNLTKKQIDRLSVNKWYHATLEKHLPSLLAGIKVNHNLGNELDFGCGFYITPDFSQAQKYINRRVESLNSNLIETDYFDNTKDEGIIMEFEVTEFASIFTNSDYNCYYFKSHNEEKGDSLDFAEFVFKNRLYPKDLQHDYDFIYGVQTDDNPTDLLLKFKDKSLTKEEVLKEFRKSYSFKQLSIHNQDFCDKMKISRIYFAKDGKEYGQWQEQ